MTMFFIDDNSPVFLGLSRKGETFEDGWVDVENVEIVEEWEMWEIWEKFQCPSGTAHRLKATFALKFSRAEGWE